MCVHFACHTHKTHSAAMMLARPPAAANARRTSAVRVPAKAKRTTARQVRARAAAGDAEKGPMEAYMDVSNKVPPLATAAAVPVVALSLLCKGITGSGLPGPLFGTIEGLSFLLLPVGAGSLIPVVQDILAEGDFSADAVLRKLKGQVRRNALRARALRAPLLSRPTTHVDAPPRTHHNTSSLPRARRRRRTSKCHQTIRSLSWAPAHRGCRSAGPRR